MKMNLCKTIKKYILYENVRCFFDIVSDNDVCGNILPVWFIVMIAIIGVLGFVISGMESIVEVILYFSMFPLMCIYNIVVKRNTQKYRKYSKINALLYVFALEYAAVKICSMSAVQYDLLIFLNVLMWLLQTAVLLFSLMKVRKEKNKKKAKDKYTRKIYSVQMGLVFLSMIPIVSQRHKKVEEINFALLVPAVIILFSVLVANCVNSILFDIIYKEEIFAEIEQHRKVVEDRKNNRRTMRRKKMGDSSASVKTE